MEPDLTMKPKTSAASLVVADWTIEPDVVVTECRARIADGAPLRIVVPAWLHGLDWAGDPWVSVPCAHRQLERITRLCLAHGLHVQSSEVGDPDPVTAICDAVDAVRIDRILLFARGRHVSSGYPLSVARRAERLSGLPVQGFAAPLAPRPQRRRRFAGGHCEPARTPRLA